MLLTHTHCFLESKLKMWSLSLRIGRLRSGIRALCWVQRRPKCIGKRDIWRRSRRPCASRLPHHHLSTSLILALFIVSCLDQNSPSHSSIRFQNLESSQFQYLSSRADLFHYMYVHAHFPSPGQLAGAHPISRQSLAVAPPRTGRALWWTPQTRKTHLEFIHRHVTLFGMLPIILKLSFHHLLLYLRRLMF